MIRPQNHILTPVVLKWILGVNGVTDAKEVCVCVLLEFLHSISVWTKRRATPVDTGEIEGQKKSLATILRSNQGQVKVWSPKGSDPIKNPTCSPGKDLMACSKKKKHEMSFQYLDVCWIQSCFVLLESRKLSACEMGRIPQNVYRWINITSGEWVRELRVCSFCVFCHSHWP